jgi:zinc-ribbon domain
VTNCTDCGNELREDAKFCDACGARIEPASAQPQEPVAPTAPEDEGLALAGMDDESPSETTSDEDMGEPEASGEPEGVDESEPGSEPMESEDQESGGAADIDAELPAEPPKAGYLVFPDSTEQPLSPSQWLIGRTDLARFVGDPGKTNEISRGHLTVFQEGDRYFIEDGKTMVQRKPSANKTWVVRGSSRILITGNGRNELQDQDEIDVAELVKLQFVLK